MCAKSCYRILLKHPISSRKMFLRKKIQHFLENLVLVVLLIDFDTKFHKNSGSFAIFCNLSPQHQGLRIIEFLNKNSDYPLFFPVKICTNNILRQHSVALLIEFLLNKLMAPHPNKNNAMHATSETLQQNSSFLQAFFI